METLVNPRFWQGRSVFLTGHTGFKGGWLALWLQSLGARVHGYALAPPTTPDLFGTARIACGLASHTLADLADADTLRRTMQSAAPEVVLHLAAQPLVRASYADPVGTFATNVMGLVHLFEAVRATPSVRAVVNVTTDKCYENREQAQGYREDDPLGGHDPYSSSKACAELVSGAWRRSFLADAGVGVATARAGNVIGGGDWAAERLVPDVLRALDAGQTLQVRAPRSTRPWQHVLEPLAGYLRLAERLHADAAGVAGAWNFGPCDDDAQPVEWIVQTLAQACPDLRWQLNEAPQPHEAHFLHLDSNKARKGLGWQPRWPLRTALHKTLDWHRAWRCGREDMRQFSLRQIADYTATPAGED